MKPFYTVLINTDETDVSWSTWRSGDIRFLCADDGIGSIKIKAVLMAALLFGLWHYPLGQNVGQVISTFIVGAIYGALRTLFDDKEDTIGVPALALAHWMFNVL